MRIAVGLAFGLIACGGGDAAVVDGNPVPDGGVVTADAQLSVRLPPANAQVDYQLGGAYPPPAGVMIVSRDRNASPAPGQYNICYVNGFQIQPDEESMWLTTYPELILRNEQGEPIIDAEWDEMLIDISTSAKRTAVATIVSDWIEGCSSDGFDAIEIDNLDSFSRSGGRLTEQNNIDAMRLFADAAHSYNMAAAQKNSAELAGRRADMQTDFVVAEECNRYNECSLYTDVYGDAVVVIEYRRNNFTQGCTNFPGLSIVLRDLLLRPAGEAGYVYDGC